MKVLGNSKDKLWLRLGEDQQNAGWYGTQKVSEYANTLNRGDEVEIKFEVTQGAKGPQKILTFIKKVGSGPAPTEKKSWGKPTETISAPVSEPSAKDESIKRQAIGKMVAQALVALQGQVDPNNIDEIIETLWSKFETKVNG
jgi:hypothetical protein